MPLYINSNIQSLQAQRNLSRNTNQLQKSMEKLASGLRINGAGDDAAGLQISETMRSQIRGSQQALRNTQDGISVLSVVDGALGQLSDIFQRIRELALQAANDTYNTAQRSAAKSEVDQLLAQVDQIGNATQFNNKFLLDGTASGIGSFYIQVGPNSTTASNAVDIVSVLRNVDASALGLDPTSVLIDTYQGAISAVNKIDTAIASINVRRGDIGAYINRFNFSLESLGINIESQSAAESRIRNVDVAQETSNLAKWQILQQASLSILTQANQAPQLALQLLQQQ